MTGFMDYCGTPRDHLTILPWNEAKQVFDGSAANNDDVPGLYHAVNFNEDAGEWRIGISFRLNPRTNYPPLSVSFGLFVTEKDSQFSVRVGTDKPHIVDKSIQSLREAFHASWVKGIKQAFEAPQTLGAPEAPKKVEANKYGFKVQTS